MSRKKRHNGVHNYNRESNPEEILKNDPNADIFLLDNIVYQNAENIDWVRELDLTIGESLGEIKKIPMIIMNLKIKLLQNFQSVQLFTNQWTLRNLF